MKGLWMPKYGRSKYLTAPLLIALATAMLAAWWSPSMAQEPDDVKEVENLVEEIHDSEEARAWWNPAWKYRQRVTIEDPKLLSSGAVYLADPDPLLLFNTNRCQDGMADLRVVTLDGQVLPSGITNFGRDDGSGMIWLAPPTQDFLKRLDLFVYYGNSQAAPSGDKLPKSGAQKGDAQFVYARAEETQPGAEPPAVEPGSFFKNLVVAEAEEFQGFGEAMVVSTAGGASGESVLAATTGLKSPVTAWSTQQVPAAGTWYAHVRYRTTPERNRAVPNPPRYVPFDLLVGGQTIRSDIPEATSGGLYRWKSAKLELPRGEVKLGLRLSGPAAPDCIILTQDGHYKPDYRDINGPVWMRFNAVDKVPQPYYVDLFCYHQTFSIHGQQGNTASYLFKDRLVYPKNMLLKRDRGFTRLSELPFYAANLPKNPAYLFGADEWTPWGETLRKGSYTWYSQIRFVASGRTRRGSTMSDFKVAYQFATRPHVSRTYRSGTEQTYGSHVFNVHMPSRLDFKTLDRMTLTFNDWGKQRLAITESLNFKPGNGPKQIMAATIANAFSPTDADNLFKAMSSIGLNALAFRLHGSPIEDDLFGGDIKWTWKHSGTSSHFFEWNFYRRVAKGTPDKRHALERGRASTPLEPLADKLPGLNYTQTVEKILEEGADKHFRERTDDLKKASLEGFNRIRYSTMDDEIGPAIRGKTINEHPLFRGMFIEYLQKQALQPSFFGIKSWDDMKAIDYRAPLAKYEENLQQVIEDEAAALKKLDNDTDSLVKQPIDNDDDSVLEEPLPEPAEKSSSKKKRRGKSSAAAPSADPEPDKEEVGGETPLEEKTAENTATATDEGPNPGELGAAAPFEAPDPAKSTLFDKRAYYWTQRFRSEFTCKFYGYHTKAFTKYFPEGTKTCANLQAMPVQIGRMWDGGLNIFDLGRKNAFSALQVEDWNWSAVNARFGMELLRAAARKNHQPLTALTVGGKPGQRIMANLMEGVRTHLFYNYGPIFAIGPVFAEDRETQRQIGAMMHQIGRTEPDLMAAKPRPAEAAILVANTSEINSAYFRYPFERERVGLYSALNEAQIPVEIVGEEEILEDDALKRYRILYVAEPHVNSKVQGKIKQWVADGGTLWADYAGLARNEYDEASPLFNEVFGLQTRGALTPYLYGGYGVAKVPMGQAVHIAKSDVFAADEIKGISFRGKTDEMSGHHAVPAWKVSTGRVLATFDNGKPAMVLNKFGKGQAWLCGFMGAMTYTTSGGPYSSAPRGPNSTPLRGQLITVPARRALTPTHLKLTGGHGVLTAVHDGPGQTVVFLTNGPVDLKDAPLSVQLPKTPKSAYSATGKPVNYKMTGTTATLPLDLPKGEGEIIVFRY